MKAFIDWLYATPLSHFIQVTPWIIPIVQTIHIICVAVLFTSMAMLDFRLLRISGMRFSVHALAERFTPWLWRVLPIMLATGLLLLVAEPNRDLQNFFFYLKMSMLIIAITITFGFQRTLRGDPTIWDTSPWHRSVGRAIGALSLCLWVVIIISGRLIAYV